MAKNKWNAGEQKGAAGRRKDRGFVICQEDRAATGTSETMSFHNGYGNGRNIGKDGYGATKARRGPGFSHSYDGFNGRRSTRGRNEPQNKPRKGSLLRAEISRSRNLSKQKMKQKQKQKLGRKGSRSPVNPPLVMLNNINVNEQCAERDGNAFLRHKFPWCDPTQQAEKTNLEARRKAYSHILAYSLREITSSKREVLQKIVRCHDGCADQPDYFEELSSELLKFAAYVAPNTQESSLRQNLVDAIQGLVRQNSYLGGDDVYVKAFGSFASKGSISLFASDVDLAVYGAVEKIKGKRSNPNAQRRNSQTNRNEFAANVGSSTSASASASVSAYASASNDFVDLTTAGAAVEADEHDNGNGRSVEDDLCLEVLRDSSDEQDSLEDFIVNEEEEEEEEEDEEEEGVVAYKLPLLALDPSLS